MTVAFVFPGQGVQKTGMGLDLYNNFDCVKEFFKKANKVLNKDIKGLCFEGSEEELKQTINSQSALLTVSLAGLLALREKTNIIPSYVAGHSLGEYSALYCAGVLSLEDTLLAIQKRSELMQEATLQSKGSMAAVIGLDAKEIEDIIKDIENVSIANYNSQKQTVITGEFEAVQKAQGILKEQGAKKIVPLSVSGAFHSPLMKSATEEFKNFLKTIKIQDAKIPVFTNTDAKITTSAEDFRLKMPLQISSSVMWVQTVEGMIKNGVDRFVEIGEGNVLKGLNKRICPEIETNNVFDTASLNATVEALK